MIDMKCRVCKAHFDRRLSSCPHCGGKLELEQNNWYKPKSIQSNPF